MRNMSKTIGEEHLERERSSPMTRRDFYDWYENEFVPDTREYCKVEYGNDGPYFFAEILDQVRAIFPHENERYPYGSLKAILESYAKNFYKPSLELWLADDNKNEAGDTNSHQRLTAMKENSGQIKTQLESDRVLSYSQMENVRDVLLEMRDSSDPTVIDFAKRLSEALARDCYCQICGRILKGETVRNCDVGTVKEQTERFEAFCQSNMQFYRDMFGHDDEGPSRLVGLP